MRRIIYTIFFVSLLAAGASTAAAQDTRAQRRMLRSGNEQYENERYTDAEIAYRRVLDMDSTSTMARYNIGNTLFRQNKFAEAAEQYGDILSHETPRTDRTVSSENWYNLGNSLYMQEKYAESVEAYKNALRRNPHDDEARYNLRMAQLKLKEQQEQQQNQQQNQQNQQLIFSLRM